MPPGTGLAPLGRKAGHQVPHARAARRDLSGGNQQKVAIARLLHHDVDLLLLDEPTRGIDVGSKAQIYKLIDELATGDPATGRKPRAILMVSSYLPELLGTCDRIAVMCRGRLGPARPVEQLNEHLIMLEAIGSPEVPSPCNRAIPRRSEFMSTVEAGVSSATSLPSRPAVNWRDWLKLVRPLLGLIFVFTVFSILTPGNFLTAFNMRILLEQTTIVGIAALGMTMIIVSGGIDLSVGSNVAFCTIITALLLNAHASPVLAAAGGIAAGLVVGVVIGGLITAAGLSPFIVTLGLMGALRGIAIGASGKGGVVYPPEIHRESWIGSLLSLSGSKWWQFIPAGAWVLLALSLLIAGTLRYTKFGRHVFAIGSNEQTARLCGVNLRPHQASDLLHRRRAGGGCRAHAVLSNVSGRRHRGSRHGTQRHCCRRHRRHQPVRRRRHHPGQPRRCFHDERGRQRLSENELRKLGSANCHRRDHPHRRIARPSPPQKNELTAWWLQQPCILNFSLTQFPGTKL